MNALIPLLVVVIFAGVVSQSSAAEPVAVASVSRIANISADEPTIKAFSLERAAAYMDAATLDWQKTHACTACHTMFPYLMARPALSAVEPQRAEVRGFFEEIVAGKREAMPNHTCGDIDGAVAIGVAVAMTINDRTTTGKLHPLTRQALDKMWTLERADGSWQWPFRDTPPLKINEHYGVTLAAIGAGMAPDDYAKSPQAVAGLARVREYLHKTTPVSLHQRAMLLWASVYVGEILSDSAKAATLAELMSVQRPDGGWSMASLVDNTNDPAFKQGAGAEKLAKAKGESGYGTEFLSYIGHDGVYKSSLASDGYATGFVIFVARQAGLDAKDARLQRGIAWLKANQRESGRWFTPSQSWHTQNMIANAGTGYAVLALAACGEVTVANEK